ncbi:uncharacterized protein [Aristolochia californica]|uniref:uncharacterized protein n=1 Tax=Aristolochia californica TaxID=171875 RepID=UPI0035D77982
MFSEGLRSLSDVHKSVHDLLQLGSTQKTLVHSGIEGCIEETLDGSLRLLDVCGTVKDAMSQMKMHLQDLQSAFRRKGRKDSDIDKKISVYFNSRKQIKKEIRNGLIAIKRAEEQWKSSLIPDKDDQLCAVISVLREARKQGEMGKLRQIQNQIEELGESIQCLEDGLQGVFRRLIQTRVSLLNLFNH